MKIGTWHTAAFVVLIGAPAVREAPAAETVGTVSKVTDTTGVEVGYPTRLAEVITATASPEAVEAGRSIEAGQVVLTKSARTHVVMASGDPEAVLSPNTFVRFDRVNRWLMREGAMLVVNHMAKLALVVAGLETIFVNSQVYVEVTERGLLVHVIEGSVILGATATGIALTTAQTGQLLRGGVPERTVLSAAEQARVDSQIRSAQQIRARPPEPSPPDSRGQEAMRSQSGGDGGGGGGGGKAVAVLLGLGAVGAGVYYFAIREDKPDLEPVPAAGGNLCQTFDVSPDRTIFVVTVANTGKADAPPSTTQLRLTGPQFSGPLTQETEAIAAGASAQVGPVVAPPGCFSPCQVEITADSAGQVDESNEGNNVAAGLCF